MGDATHVYGQRVYLSLNFAANLKLFKKKKVLKKKWRKSYTTEEKEVQVISNGPERCSAQSLSKRLCPN